MGEEGSAVARRFRSIGRRRWSHWLAGGLTRGGGGGGVRCFRAGEEGASCGKRSLEARLVKKARLRRVAGWVEEREDVG